MITREVTCTCCHMRGQSVPPSLSFPVCLSWLPGLSHGDVSALQSGEADPLSQTSCISFLKATPWRAAEQFLGGPSQSRGGWEVMAGGPRFESHVPGRLPRLEADFQGCFQQIRTSGWSKPVLGPLCPSLPPPRTPWRSAAARQLWMLSESHPRRQESSSKCGSHPG